MDINFVKVSNGTVADDDMDLTTISDLEGGKWLPYSYYQNSLTNLNLANPSPTAPTDANINLELDKLSLYEIEPLKHDLARAVAKVDVLNDLLLKVSERCDSLESELDSLRAKYSDLQERQIYNVKRLNNIVIQKTKNN